MNVSNSVKHRNISGLRPWKKGQSGNPKGRTAKLDCLIGCIKAELEARSDKAGFTNEQLIAAVLVKKARVGNMKAIELVLEYTATKPKTENAVELKGTLLVKWDGNGAASNP